MAYDSDARVKNLLKKISKEADLKNLKPRFFQESHDDQKKWEDGGLTFKVNNIECGSNDFGWFLEEKCKINGKEINQKPVVIVEGTFGIQSGNTGSAQFARFSHAYGAVCNDICGILFQDFVIKKGRTQPDLITACLEISKRSEQPYLVIDIKDEQLMIKLLKAYDSKDKSEIKTVINEAKYKMKLHINNYKKKITKKFFLKNNKNIIQKKFYEIYTQEKSTDISIIKMMFFNKNSFMDSGLRNAHTVLGEMLALSCSFYPINCYLLLPRFSQGDIGIIKNLNSKELKLFFSMPKLNILGYEDLEADDSFISDNINAMRDKIFKGNKKIKAENLDKSKYYSAQEKNKFEKKLTEKILNGCIKINL